MKKKSLMFLAIYLIITFIGVSFAWMQAADGEAGDSIIFSYNPDDEDQEGTQSLSVKSRNISAEVYIYDETTQDYETTHDLSQAYLSQGLIPNKPLLMKVEFINRDTDVQKVNLELAGVECDSQALLENMYFALTSTEGYPEYSVLTPSAVYVQFDENKIGQSSYTIPLVENLLLPSSVSVDEDTGDETITPITLYCYFILSRLSNTNLSNLQLDIGYFRVVL